MRFRVRLTALPLAAASALLGLVGGHSEPASARPTPELTMSPSEPGSYLPGASLTLTGRLDVSKRTPVVVERNLGRDGDRWIAIEGSQATTRSNGSFRIQVPASAMQNIYYRVAAANSATPPVQLRAAIQETLVSVSGVDTYSVTTGQPMQVRVSTTGGGNASFLASPPIAGRTLTLQQRVDGFRWQTLATTLTDALGAGQFVLPAPEPGTLVLRVRQEDWTPGNDRIGWHASYPTYVEVLGHGAEQVRAKLSPAQPLELGAPGPESRRLMAAQSTAAARYKWRVPRSDFDWEYGESLTSLPTRGTRRRGSWSDYSDGTGRAAMRNGALVLLSENEYSRARTPSSLGSTWITLNGHPRVTGRWETRLFPSVFAGGEPMDMVAELIPTSAAERKCSPEGIVIAHLNGGQAGVRIGVRDATGAARWTRSVSTYASASAPHAYAVEVASNHITWFVDGSPVGTIKDPAAIPTGPLTMRVSLRDPGTGSLQRTRLGVDWVRLYSLRQGKQVVRARTFTPGTLPSGC